MSLNTCHCLVPSLYVVYRTPATLCRHVCFFFPSVVEPLSRHARAKAWLISEKSGFQAMRRDNLFGSVNSRGLRISPLFVRYFVFGFSFCVIRPVRSYALLLRLTWLIIYRHLWFQSMLSRLLNRIDFFKMLLTLFVLYTCDFLFITTLRLPKSNYENIVNIKFPVSLYQSNYLGGLQLDVLNRIRRIFFFRHE